MPRSPGAVELADVGELVVTARRRVPAVFQAVADESQESRASAHLDQEPRDRITLAVEAHQVLGVFLDLEQTRQRDLAAPGQQVDGDLVVPPPLALVFAQERRPFVGPARHRAAEIAGEDRVGHFVGKAEARMRSSRPSTVIADR